MINDYNGFTTLERKDYFDILRDLPRLPKGAMPVQPFSMSNPAAIDSRTGVYYHLKNGKWELADKK